MPATIQEVFASKMKHKEQVTLLTGLAKNDPAALEQLFDYLQTGSAVEKGTAAEVMKFVSKEDPALMLPYVDALIEHITDKVPRVRWGCPESLGNMAQNYPDPVGRAVPDLLANLKDPSTVVRWCAAYALAEIARHNLEKQPELTGLFQQFIETEPNNGVRNVYIIALKEIKKAHR